MVRRIWQLETDGKPLETVHNFLIRVWSEANLDAMMLPLKQEDGHQWHKKIITKPDDLSRSNPFTPIMSENIAQFIPEFTKENPGKKLAVLLRPCEIRAFNQIKAKLPGAQKNILVISADCLGTFPEEEFSWRANRKGSQENLTDESIRFSRQGGIAPYRYRAACQLCDNPVASDADININIVGMPIRQEILVSTPNGITKKFGMTELAKNIAGEELIEQHKTTTSKVIYRNRQTKKRLSEALVENTDLNLENLVKQLNDCGQCTNCMDVCPICTTNKFTRNEDGLLSRELVADWMVSCVGCGMCEQACTQHKPLAVIFSIINDQLAQMNDLILN